MVTISRAFVVGGADSWVSSIGDTTGIAVERELPQAVVAGDLVVLDAASAAGAAAMPLGNAFSTCRALKVDPQVLVFVAVRSEDRFAKEIARFCMADGVLTVTPDGTLTGVDRVVERVAPRRERSPLDNLLERLEGDLAGDSERAASVLQRMLRGLDDGSAVARWTDVETGLFDGPFAAFKLDEEFKRAMRFHQPLSLVLLEAGVAEWPADAATRATVLAEIASIFLNECRDIDVLARFTDTVFLFLLPGTGPDGASIATHRMVEALGAREFGGGLVLHPAAGIVTLPDPAIRDRQAFLTAAETALERARSSDVGPVCRATG